MHNLSASLDPADNAVGQYLRQSDSSAGIVSKALILQRAKHHSGFARRVYRYTLDIDGMEDIIYAKHCENPVIIAREFQILKELSRHADDGTVQVPFPLFCSEEVLLTEGFSGKSFPQALSDFGRFPRQRLNRQIANLVALFHDLGRWLVDFHDNSALTRVLILGVEGIELDTYALCRFEEHMRAWGGLFISPKLRERMEDEFRKILSSQQLVTAIGPTHGDFCPAQLVLDLKAPRACVVDFEDTHRGSQIQDVARFCANCGCGE